MNEILSAIRLKDRIIIISLMVIFAVLLAVGIGAVTEATVDPHVHSFEYHLERGEDGSFDYVGVCTDEACENPVYAWDILNAEDSVVSEVKIAPTCTSDGLMKYSFTPLGETAVYTYEEKISALSPTYSHTFVAEDATIEDGSSSLTIKCTNEGCADKETLEVDVAVDMTFVEKVADATCHTPRVEKYTYNYNGVTVSVTASTEVDGIPHTLNGVYVTELQDENGYFPYGTEGIDLDVVGYLPCGYVGNGHYVCEVCEKKNNVQVQRDDHKYEFLEDMTILPTDKNEGKAYVKCTEEDCGQLKTITLPVVAPGDDNIINRDQDREEQTVKYTYVSGDYGFVIEKEIVIPWNNHLFEYSEDDVVRPTFDKDGSVTLRCQNSVCSEYIVVTLPKMNEASNTTVAYDHILEKKTFTYLYTNTEYGFEITFSYDTSWIDHSYVYIEGETVNPDLEKDGVAYARCYYEGCPKYHEITIPKIVVDKNASNIALATEQSAALYRYSYYNREYDFTITIDFTVGEPLSHEYKYGLELNILTGKFDFVAKCDQPGCLESEIREENVPVTITEYVVSCTTDGYIVVSYERDGVIYEMPPIKQQDRLGHEYVVTNITNPTFSKEGSATLVCENEGCTEANITIVLPKIEFGVTAFEVVPGADDGQLYYLYSNKEYNFEHFFLV